MSSNNQVKLTKAQATAYGKLTKPTHQIRYLLKTTDWSRRQIADCVGVIYQFVWNVEHQAVKS